MTGPVLCLDPTTSAMPTERQFVHWKARDAFYEVLEPGVPRNTVRCAFPDSTAILLHVNEHWPLVSYADAAAGRLRGATVYYAHRIKEN